MAETKTMAKPPVGVFCWNEQLSTDPAATKKFYTSLMGWTAMDKDMGPMGTYTVFMQGETQIGGLMKNPQPGAPSAWMSYIHVKDVDASTKKAEKLGAHVCVQPSDIPNIGRFSVLTDPAGATIGLYQPK